MRRRTVRTVRRNYFVPVGKMRRNCEMRRNTFREHGAWEFLVHDSPRPHLRARAGWLLAQQRPKRSSGSSGRRPSSFRTPPASPRASRTGNEIHGATTSRLCRFPSTDPCFPCGASVLHDRRTVDVLQQLQQTRRLQPFRTVSMPNSDLSRFQIHTTSGIVYT